MVIWFQARATIVMSLDKHSCMISEISFKMCEVPVPSLMFLSIPGIYPCYIISNKSREIPL